MAVGAGPLEAEVLLLRHALPMLPFPATETPADWPQGRCGRALRQWGEEGKGGGVEQMRLITSMTSDPEARSPPTVPFSNLLLLGEAR